MPPITQESGGAGLVSTSGDYKRFADMLLRRGGYDGGALLGRKIFDPMVCHHMRGDLASRGQAQLTQAKTEGIGFGLRMFPMLDPARAEIIGPAGEFAPGDWASTAFRGDPFEEMAVILMTRLALSLADTLRPQHRVLSYQALIS